MSAFYRLNTEGDLNDDKLALIEDYVSGLEMKDWKTKFGKSAAKDWPNDATIKLRKTSGRKLTDLFSNIKNNLIVSKRLHDLLADQCKSAEVEYLPVRIHDHRERLLSDEYVIVNPIGTFDCLDLEASDVLRDKDDAAKILAVNEIVLSAKKVQHAPPIFRIREKPASYIVSRIVATAISDGGFSNVRWQALEPK